MLQHNITFFSSVLQNVKHFQKAEGSLGGELAIRVTCRWLS